MYNLKQVTEVPAALAASWSQSLSSRERENSSCQHFLRPTGSDKSLAFVSISGRAGMLLIGNCCLCWFRKSFGEPKRYANRYRNAHVKPERMARLPKPYGAPLYARRREDDLEERILPGVALRRQFLNKLSPLTSIVATCASEKPFWK
jgi:hypothetical protein